MESSPFAQNDYEPNFVLTNEIVAGLIPDPSPGAAIGETQKMINPDFPDLYIRVPRDDEKAEEDTGTLREKYREAYGNMGKSGLKVVPFSLVEHEGTVYTMARRIDGVPLRDEMANNPAIADQYDQIFANQIDQLWSIRGTDEIYPPDAFGVQNFMWGRPAGTEEEPAAYFVDIKPPNQDFKSGITEAEDAIYANTMANLAFIIIENKTELGLDMPETRIRLYGQINQMIHNNPGNTGLIDHLESFRQALETNNEDLIIE